ncbi:hypothetical protein [Chitinolyticbacter albus]|uniref:hypothetical protein n=1 Tax=Chitinolyticbacter albus TaxID=2961951 RepID=UPI00210AB6D5|nr:hypothetical protein [Chitinolyticbacter albus]
MLPFYEVSIPVSALTRRNRVLNGALVIGLIALVASIFLTSARWNGQFTSIVLMVMVPVSALLWFLCGKTNFPGCLAAALMISAAIVAFANGRNFETYKIHTVKIEEKHSRKGKSFFVNLYGKHERIPVSTEVYRHHDVGDAICIKESRGRLNLRTFWHVSCESAESPLE